jgi:hypothetical protein
MPNASPSTFEIGLVMAGAISAGAYTAGVMDFLIQALDEWEAAKRDPAARVPRHSVRLRALSGASAGAMTSAITAVALGSEVDPVTDPANPPKPERNRFYDAWVRQVDIAKLLGTSDIEAAGQVISLLNAAPLKLIADSALVTPKLPARRAYVDDPLAVMLTVANLRGVPYGFQLFGDRPDTLYGMFEHMDHMRFAVSWDGRSVPAARVLSAKDAPKGEWPALVAAALASGAFPGGLAPCLLDRPWKDYEGRHKRNPIWKGTAPSYSFLCVDGGLMNNEPLELARQYLSGGAQEHSPRDGEEAHRAVIMIDPFPNSAAFDEDNFKPDPRLISVAMQMFSSLKNQARFKPEELDLAEREDVFSRFMIAPSRQDASGRPAEPAMGSSILGGFGGFFHESFRRHDFQLGRRNCQAFLKWHFCVPESNPIADATDPAVRSDFHVRNASGTIETFSARDRRQIPFLPLIPLVGSAATPVPLPPPPSGKSVDLGTLEKMVAKRVKAVGQTLIRSDLSALIGGPVRFAVSQAWNLRYAGKVTDKAMSAVKKELARLP